MGKWYASISGSRGRDGQRFAVLTAPVCSSYAPCSCRSAVLRAHPDCIFCAHSLLKILNFSTNQNEFYGQIDRQNVLLVKRAKRRVWKFWGARCSRAGFRDGERE